MSLHLVHLGSPLFSFFNSSFPLLSLNLDTTHKNWWRCQVQRGIYRRGATSGFHCGLYCDPRDLRLLLGVCCCCSTGPSGRSCPFVCCRALCSPWGTKNNSGGFQYARHEGCGCQEQRLDPHIPQKERLSVLCTLLQVINPGNKGGVFFPRHMNIFRSTILFS